MGKMRVGFLEETFVDVEIEIDWEVWKAKLAISHRLGLILNFELSFARVVLTEDRRTLSEYGVQDDSVLTVVLPDASKVRFVMVSVQTLAGDSKPLCMSAECNMYDLFINIVRLLNESLKTLRFIIKGQVWSGRSYLVHERDHDCGGRLTDHGIVGGTVISVIKEIEYTNIQVHNVVTGQLLNMCVPENSPCCVTVRNEVERRWGIPSIRQCLYVDVRCDWKLTDEDRLDDYSDDNYDEIVPVSKIYMLERMCDCGACQTEWFRFGWICPAVLQGDN